MLKIYKYLDRSCSSSGVPYPSFNYAILWMFSLNGFYCETKSASSAISSSRCLTWRGVGLLSYSVSGGSIANYS